MIYLFLSMTTLFLPVNFRLRFIKLNVYVKFLHGKLILMFLKPVVFKKFPEISYHDCKRGILTDSDQLGGNSVNVGSDYPLLENGVFFLHFCFARLSLVHQHHTISRHFDKKDNPA